MKTKIIISVFFLPFCFALRATATPAQERWTAERVIVEKNIDGVVEVSVYESEAEIRNHIPCPDESEINEKIRVLRYFDCMEQTEGDRLTVKRIGLYGANDGKFTLIIVCDHVNNPASGHTERIEEKRIITFKKQSENIR